MKIKTTKDRRKRISLRQRKRINGTAERPRLRVFRSVSHIYAQVIDDMSGTTLVSAASTEAGVKGSGTKGGNIAGAKELGKAVAERLKAYTPMPAGLAIQATTNLECLAVQPWPGIGVLAAQDAVGEP